MPAVNLFWNRCRGERWADLHAVDVAHAHFDGLEGVFVLWHAGAAPSPVTVGQGPIREAIQRLRADPEVAPFRGHGLFVTWARAERALRDGIEAYLAAALKPKVPRSAPAVSPIEVNLPGQQPLEKAPAAQAEASQPEQVWEDLLVEPSTKTATAVRADAPAAAPATAAAKAAEPEAPKRLSDLQASFANLLTKRREPVKTGFFGNAKPKDEKEGLVQETLRLILEEAVNCRASDIHLEPLEAHLRVRLRVDGMLYEELAVPNALDLRLVSYIRVLCGLDPEKTQGTAKPEDGRMAVTIKGSEADLRLSTFPTSFGEKAVLRVIPRTFDIPTLSKLGIRGEVVPVIEELIGRPQGLIVVTGPTGSGKSTTLYTILNALNQTSRNIVTLEDPIEKKIPGIAQGVLQPKIGFTFSNGLRAILRQDPNIIMVGEIRDPETAEIAMSGALTGHMLLTTLHTNSAIGAITRLVDMGLEPFLISSALTAVCAQRLARKTCEHCRQAAELSPGERAELQSLAERVGLGGGNIPSKTYRARGCGACRNTGYRGRLLLFEVLRLTPVLRPLVLAKASQDEIKKAATADGFEPLLIDGLIKVAEGLTTVAELGRVVGMED